MFFVNYYSKIGNIIAMHVFSSAHLQINDAIKNPYVGLYSIRGYMLAEDATFSLPETSAAIDSDSSAFELSLIEINLKNYANCALSDNSLSQIDSILSA